MYNNTLEDIIIEADTKIAEIEIYSTDVDVCRMAVRELDEQHASIHECKNTRPDFINEDYGMVEEEKEEAFMRYLKRGYHHPSMTKEVKSKASLTEMYFKLTVLVRDENFDDQFDLNHLSKTHKRLALKIFRKKQRSIQQTCV